MRHSGEISDSEQRACPGPCEASAAGRRLDLAEGRQKEDGLTLPGSRITWVIGGAVVALIFVAGVDALRSPDDEATASATTAVTTTPFSPTTTVVTDVDDKAAEDNNLVIDQDPEDLVDEAGNPLPACSQEQLQVSIPPVRDLEGDGFFGLLLVRGADDCRQAYPYFRVALRDSRDQQLLVWSGRLLYTEDPAPFDPTSAHFGPVPCQSWEVFPAFVTVGYERSPEGQVFRLGAHCQPPPEP